jgi:hypothetical protein
MILSPPKVRSAKRILWRGTETRVVYHVGGQNGNHGLRGCIHRRPMNRSAKPALAKTSTAASIPVAARKLLDPWSSLLTPIIKPMCAFLGQPGTPWPAFIVFIIKMYFIFFSYRVRSRCPLALLSLSRNQVSVLDGCLSGFGFMGCELPHFDRHVQGCCGNSSRNGISSLGIGHVNDPVAQQKFFRDGYPPHSGSPYRLWFAFGFP